MNKLFATFALIFATFSLSHAQDGYVKFHANSEFRGETVKTYTGEVLPYLNSSKPNRINLIIGKDTITDLTKTSSKYEVLSSSPTSYASQKEDLLQAKKGGIVRVDATSIPSTDTVTLISDVGVQVTQLISKREADVKQSDLGRTCRLIISNTPTIFYEIEKLKQFVEPPSVDPNDGGNTTSDIEKSRGGIAWWVWALTGLAVIGIGAFVWFKLFRKSGKSDSDEYVCFNGGSLKDFAKPYGGLDYLSSIDPKGLIPTKKYYDRLNQGEKNALISQLSGQKIRVKLPDNRKFGFGDLDDSKMQNQDSYTKTDTSKETFQIQSNFEKTSGIAEQLRDMESRLTRAIQRANLGTANANQLNELRNEKQQLESKLRELLIEKREAEEKFAKAEDDLVEQKQKLLQSQNEIGRLQQDIKGLKERVTALDFIKPYSESVVTYLKYCQQVSNDAFSLYNRINQRNPHMAVAAGQLLMKYQSSVNNIPVGNWLQTTDDIKETGATTNKQLIRSFSQIQNDADKEKEFKRLLFSQVLVKFSSSILILAEAFKKLSRFGSPNEFANEAHSNFTKHVSEIVIKAKSVGMELKHVSLFESWENYIGKVEEKGDEKSSAYQEINGLEKGAIAEIVSIGVKTPFEDSPTIVILA